ncbi:aryl-alcohol dehydrogenase-like predicted oxidoreductase [Methylobacterium sp. PvP062]|jgi:aryl-alcohol dehydrogenase-like predicted oxidoreductase|uniref:Aryl-alcohol dehydrogenase-like predicted oxidoreductase n=1 Tax=Methylobacterium radiotolerans TaxID=31998 RepID=A0ABV2NCK1_9HYPH|nr:MULTISPECIES: aldo/keto reductase [Methylobacterium]MBY0254593.1 aldo/keto reductase [Methylobacterium organophilum]MCX7333479.1 aldo/keto reductase [Hyphomicrobiales bacterium]MBP2492546.1 aryl-alcohol dehydrogenase-like predicted oxidoreductase [Methylobacterium sp. PvP105]MBP2501082.1 aryl-alcohol dehydrogenase-like predicted oxidoreductase [Methylobacterium sp. PvP109]ONF50499.1 alcohol dehydrogenase [Methylobacterium radiotolerans]
MDRRRIGRSDLTVAPFCLGGNVFGWTADEAASFAILDRFVESGFDFIDTADVYSRWAPGHVGGESETVIGKWLAARPGARDRIVLATKVGMDLGGAGQGLSAAHIERACEASLRRLGVDRIDLYQSHLDDATVPLEETLRAHERLITAGKVRAIGASNYTAARLAEALGIAASAGLPRYECLQPDYSLAQRGYEAELEPLCRAEQIGVIGYFSLAAGFLTGKYRSARDAAGRARENRVAKYLNPRGLALLDVLDAVAQACGASPAQVALAWIIARPGITAPIASATSVAQLDELLGAVRLTLAPEAIDRLDAASAGGIEG